MHSTSDETDSDEIDTDEIESDEIDEFGDCSLHSSVIQCLNKHYNHTNFKDIPCSLTSIITTYTNDLFGDINEFETKYRKVRNEFKQCIYSDIVKSGINILSGAFDRGDVYNLKDFIEPRLKTNYEYENFIMCMNIQEQVNSTYFKNMFVNYSKTIEEIICIYFTSLQDYFDYTSFKNQVFVKRYTIYNKYRPCGLYCTSTDDDDVQFLDSMQQDRYKFYRKHRRWCDINGIFNKYHNI